MVPVTPSYTAVRYTMNDRPMPSKTANFGGSVDIAARQSGSTDALKSIGVSSPEGMATPDAGLGTALKDLGKTRMGIKAEKPPELKTVPSHAYTTSGALQNPKVAFLKEATQDDAPNYGNASSDVTSCATCKAYTKQDKVMGHCKKYDFYANADYTCDAWVSKKGRAPSQFIRLKLR